MRNGTVLFTLLLAAVCVANAQHEPRSILSDGLSIGPYLGLPIFTWQDSLPRVGDALLPKAESWPSAYRVSLLHWSWGTGRGLEFRTGLLFGLD